MDLKLNLHKLFISAFNTMMSISFFFTVRRLLLHSIGIKVGKNTTVHRGVKLFCVGNLTIGKGSTVNYKCFLDARGGLTIGDNVNISHCVKIYTMTHDIDDPTCKTISSPVTINNNAWIFPNVLIMPGVNIEEGAVVYPGSIVTKDLNAYTIYAGNPAKPIRERVKKISYQSSFPVWFGI